MQGRPVPKKYVYMIATLVASAIFLPFQAHTWALYVSACAGYTALVFGLRWQALKRLRTAPSTNMLTSKILLTHANFLATVIGWVWLLVILAPHVPYILRTEDSDRPYFGLAFFGIVGLMFLEMAEQRYLRPVFDPGDSQVQVAGIRSANTRKTN